MEKKEQCRQIYKDFRDLCSQGKQSSCFSHYCLENGLTYETLRGRLKAEYKGVRRLNGYCMRSHRQNSRGAVVGEAYLKLYEDFKALCCRGEQPGSFYSYCEEHGYDRWRVYNYLSRRKLSIIGLPGYNNPKKNRVSCGEIPFEEVIFEESGFVPAGGGNVITVKVDGHVSVSFPSDTDLDVVARFVRKLGKEAGHVGS